MTIILPTSGQDSWDVPLNAALTTLDTGKLDTAAVGATSGTNVFTAKVTGDSSPRLAITAGGSINGPAAGQVNFGTSGSAANFAALRTSGTDNVFSTRVTGDSSSRIFINADGSMNFSAGSGSADVVLSRSGAATAQVAGNLSVTGTSSFTGAVSTTAGVSVGTTLAVTSTSTLSGNVTHASGAHMLSTGTAPTAAAGANAGTSPPSPVVAAGSTDTRGSVTFGTGTGPAAGNECVVTFNAAYGSAPVVMLTPTNSATAALNPYVTSVGTSSFTVGFQSAPAASQTNTVYAIAWHTIG